MFETSVVGSHAVAPRHRVSLLSVSLIAHSIAIAGAITISVASVSFPKDAPNQFELLRLAAPMSVPPPLGTPEGNNKPKSEPQQQKSTTPPPQPSQPTAPNIVPDQPPQVATGPETPGNTVSDDTPGTGPKGVPWGDPHSVATDLDAPPAAPVQTVDNTIYEVRGDVKAPHVISRVEPRFPNALIQAHMSGTVTVRAVIDKNGIVRNVEVVRSSFRAFEEPVMQALPQWRFAPGSLNGRAVDTVYELTVKFTLSR